MRIALISSWPPRPCGIATYSNDLVHSLREKGNSMYIVCHTDGGSPGEKNVYPVIDNQNPGWDENLYTVVKQIKPDIVHIQHEYGLYKTKGDHAAALFRPLFRWKVEDNFRVIVTYHSVYSSLNKTMALYIDVMQKLADAGIVHEPYQWSNLPVNLGRIVDNVYIIPHGAKIVTSLSKENAKKSLALEGKKVIGMLGWFAATKGFERVIYMWDELSKELGSDTVLILAGDARELDPSQKVYKQKLLSLVERCKSKERIKVILGSFNSQEYNKILSTFDVMVMPYTFTSQSGNLAHAFALGVPVIASAMEGLKAEVEASGAGIVVHPEDEDELRRAIITLMNDDSLRGKYSKRALKYVKEKIGWPIIAEKHILLYKNLISKKRIRKRDFRSEAMLES